MKTQERFNIGGVICLFATIWLMYQLLLCDDIFPLSITAVQLSINHWAHHWHVLAVGLLPVYVALVFFGAAVCGLIFGSVLHNWLRMLLIKSNSN